MKIKHREYGVVDGVECCKLNKNHWHKFEIGRSSYFDPEQGWALVPEKEWVTIEVEKEGLSQIVVGCNLLAVMGKDGWGKPMAWRYPAQQGEQNND